MPARVDNLVFSPDGRSIAILLSSGHVLLREVDGNRERTFDVSARVRFMTFMPNSEGLIVSDPETIVALDLVRETQRVIGRHDRLAGDYAPLPDGRFVSSNDRELRLWNLDGSPALLARDDLPIDSICTSPDGGQLAYTTNDGSIHVLDLTTRSTRTVKVARASLCALSDDAKLLATILFGGGPVFLTNVTTGQTRRLTSLTTRTMAWLGRTHRLVTGTIDGGVRVFETDSDLVQVFRGHPTEPTVAVSRDGVDDSRGVGLARIHR
jgi:WD40 repeat protein